MVKRLQAAWQDDTFQALVEPLDNQSLQTARCSVAPFQALVELYLMADSQNLQATWRVSPCDWKVTPSKLCQTQQRSESARCLGRLHLQAAPVHNQWRSKVKSSTAGAPVGGPTSQSLQPVHKPVEFDVDDSRMSTSRPAKARRSPPGFVRKEKKLSTSLHASSCPIRGLRS